MKQLNSQQKIAVQTTSGRLLVLAGAGSGKTNVIAHRIAHLIQSCQIAPQSILGLTFTNKAAAEMRHRLESLIGPASARLTPLSTFHSFCMQVLRREIGRLGYTRDFSLYDERDLERLIKQLVRDMLGHEGDLPSLAPTRAALMGAANEGLSGKEPLEENPLWHDQFSQDLYVRLQSTLRAYNAVSFDNLISLTLRLFEENPALLDHYQDRYRYLMIDEYQDTNPAQFRLAELLAKKYNNLCVVGDDDQSIYGWRGAEVNHILHFQADHTVKLEQNYRSTPIILEAAHSMIQHNQSRHPKKLWSADTGGELIEIFNASTESEEAQAVVERLIHFRETAHLRWRDIAILYRSNALSRPFELALLQASWQKEGQWVRGIPFAIFGGLAFTERGEIKDLLAFLRVIANPLDQEALLRIINVPRRGISDTFLDEITQTNRTAGTPLWHLLKQIQTGQISFSHHPRGVQGIRSFVDVIEQAQKKFQKPPLADALVWFLETIDYKKAIEEEVKSDKMRAFKGENVQECVNAIARYETDAEESTLQDFVSQTTLQKHSFDASAKQAKEDAVQLMTLHSAKGLEFPICFIVGLEDHILPHEKSRETTGIEEERRLFYVGITRARKRLVLSMARCRMRMGKPQPTHPSRFLFEIPKHLLKPTSPKLIA